MSLSHHGRVTAASLPCHYRVTLDLSEIPWLSCPAGRPLVSLYALHLRQWYERYLTVTRSYVTQPFCDTLVSLRAAPPPVATSAT